MPANSRWDLIQRLKVKIVKNPGNGRLNNLNDPVLNVLSTNLFEMILWYVTLRIARFLDLIHRFAFKKGHGVLGTGSILLLGSKGREGEALAQLRVEFLTYIPLALSMRSTAMYAV